MPRDDQTRGMSAGWLRRRHSRRDGVSALRCLLHDHRQMFDVADVVRFADLQLGEYPRVLGHTDFLYPPLGPAESHHGLPASTAVTVARMVVRRAANTAGISPGVAVLTVLLALALAGFPDPSSVNAQDS